LPLAEEQIRFDLHCQARRTQCEDFASKPPRMPRGSGATSKPFCSAVRLHSALTLGNLIPNTMLAANQKALTALHDAKLELIKQEEGYLHLRHDNTLPTPVACDRPPSNKILGLRAAP